MEKEKQAKFQVTNNFNCPIGQYIANIEHQVVHFDKDMQPVFASEMQKPTREYAESGIKNPNESNTSIPQNASEDDILDLLFKVNDQDHEATIILLTGILRGRTKKTEVKRDLDKYSHRFNLVTLSIEDRTKVINAWINKLGFSANFKSRGFTEKDWNTQ